MTNILRTKSRLMNIMRVNDTADRIFIAMGVDRNNSNRKRQL